MAESLPQLDELHVPGGLPQDMFIGRHNEMGGLIQALSNAKSGNGRLVMLTGEPGIGKTRTSRRLVSLAEAHGAQALWGWCYEEQGAPPYWPWILAFRAYVQQQDTDQLRSQLGAGASDIAAIVPEILERLPDLEHLPVLELDRARFRFFDSVLTFLKNAARTKPIVIVLDDLHSADKASLLLLEFIAREVSNTHLLILGAYRDAEISRFHPLAQTLGALIQERGFQRIRLGGLAPGEVDQFIKANCSVTPTATLIDNVHQRTGGNPLFMGELVRLLGEGAPNDERSWEMQIPEGVRDAVSRRLSRLSAPCNEVLTIASVIGNEFNLSTLETLTEIRGQQMLVLMEEALQIGVIQELPPVAGCYQFAHGLIRETLAVDLSLSRRVRMHAQIGETLEDYYGANAIRHSAELSHHFAAAEPLLGPEKLVFYSLRAGEQALSTYAHEEARMHFQRGLAAKLGDHSLARISAGNAQHQSVDLETAELKLGLGLAQAAIFGRHQFQEAIENLTCAFDYFIEVGELSRAVYVAQYPYPYWARRLPGVMHLLERALDIVPSDSLEAGHLLAFYGEVIGVDRTDYAGAKEAFDRALAIAKRQDDAALELRVLTWSAIADCFHFRFSESLEKSLPAIALARQSNDLYIEVDAYHWAALAMIITGDIAGASLKAADGLSLAERIHDRQRLASLLWVNACVSQIRGDWETARGLSNRGLDAWHQDPRFLGHRTVLEHQLGNFGEGEAYLKQLREVTSLAKSEPGLEHGVLALEIALTARITGDPAGAEIAEGAADAVLSAAYTTPAVGSLASMGLALLAVNFGRPEEAARHYAALAPTLHDIVTVEMHGDHLLGLLASTTGRYDLARVHFESAVAICSKSGCLPELAWSCYDYASALLGSGDPDGPVRAATLLEDSLELSRNLGMRPLERRVRELQTRFGAKLDPAPRHPVGLTEREVEVLSLIAAGKSNREIAAELFISLNTVERHVSNILNKTGTANRADATAFAMRSNLVS